VRFPTAETFRVFHPAHFRSPSDHLFQVTIVSRRPRLLSDNKPEKFVTNLERCLTKNGIVIKANAGADLADWPGQSVIKGPVAVRLSNGESIDADLVYVCTGVAKVVDFTVSTNLRSHCVADQQ
jgi:pyruvate/2-oxoglutarate dehydrogenase complex dihydrolipoamide dehydrogenase (E3) component